MTIDDLKMVQTYKYAIRSIEDTIERLRSEMERATQTLSHAPAHTEGRDKLAYQVQRMLELETARAREVADMEEHIDRCRVWLCTIPEQQAKILQLRYMDGLKWEEVAEKSGYDKRYCHKIHNAAMVRLIGRG